MDPNIIIAALTALMVLGSVVTFLLKNKGGDERQTVRIDSNTDKIDGLETRQEEIQTMISGISDRASRIDEKVMSLQEEQRNLRVTTNELLQRQIKAEFRNAQMTAEALNKLSDTIKSVSESFRK